MDSFKQMTVMRPGLHMAPGDSSKGLTKALYNVLKVSRLRYLIVLNRWCCRVVELPLAFSLF